MHNFQKARKIWKDNQAIEMAEENRRIQAYCDERDRKQVGDDVGRKKAQQAFDTVKNRMVDKLNKDQEEKLKAEQVLQNLYAIEHDEKEQTRILVDLERNLRARIDHRIGLEQQKKAQYLTKQLEDAENRLFYEEQMRLLAEKDKLHQLSDEKRRRKMNQHRKDTEVLLNKRKEERIAAAKGNQDANAGGMQEEQRRQTIIEEERHKILKEHAAALIGHLPRDILTEIGNLD
jgi:Trichohyalin-plectin-homology domain